MFNLLPKAEKEAIRREYRLRLVVVTLWFFSATVAIALMLLMPSYLRSSQREDAAQGRFDLLSDNVKKQNVTKEQTALLDAKRRLSLVDQKAPALYLHELFMRVVADTGGRVSVHALALRAEGDTRVLDIQGVAQTRASLLSYVKNIESTGLFDTVDVPPSNFAKNAELDFSLRAVISKTTP